MTTTLLAVDDSKTMRKVLEITFAGESEYRAVLAESAEDALTKLRAEKPRIVLLDAALKGTSGYDLCQKIKSEAPGTGVILLSSRQIPFDRGKGKSSGVDDFIDKPFDTQQLIDKVGGLAKQPAQVAAPQPTAAPAPQPAAAPAPQRMPAAPAPQRPAPQISQRPLMQPSRPVTSSPTAARPVAPSAPQASKLPPGEPRPRVQTLAYGASAAKPAPVAPSPAASRPAVSTQTGVGAVSARPAARPQGTAPGSAASAAPQVAPARPAVTHPDAPPAASAAQMGLADLEGKLQGLGLTGEQVRGVLTLSKEVVEQAVWEVVPVLAETLIREEINRLTKE